MTTSRHDESTACVAGDMDLVRALGLGGITSVVLADAGAPPRYSRFCVQAWPWPDAWASPDVVLITLAQVARAHPGRPVLYYQCDADLLLFSRHRESIGRGFRMVMAEASLVEDLVDKSRFQALAERLGLPVPRAVVVPSGATEIDPQSLRFPVIVKPVTRHPSWTDRWGGAKAVLVETSRELQAAAADLARHAALLVQEMVAGPEAAIESYHVYVDPGGTIAGEFTGRKLRTLPSCRGDSTALVTTDAADVRATGRDVTRRLSLTGVAKLDFKRGPDGRLYLLEVNPRFTLWHHLAAVAGLNIPALVHADLTGGERPQRAAARAGVCWCRDLKDVRAARASGMSLREWVQWARTCEAHTPFTWDDPLPLVGAVCWRAAVRPAARAWRAGTRALGVE